MRPVRGAWLGVGCVPKLGCLGQAGYGQLSNLVEAAPPKRQLARPTAAQCRKKIGEGGSPILHRTFLRRNRWILPYVLCTMFLVRWYFTYTCSYSPKATVQWNYLFYFISSSQRSWTHSNSKTSCCCGAGGVFTSPIHLKVPI